MTGAMTAIAPPARTSNPGVVGEAEALFRRLSPYPGDGLILHCRRLHAFAKLLLDREGVRVNEDAAYLVAVVHDLGLVCDRSLGPNFTYRAHKLAETILDRCGAPADVRADVAEALLHHQRVFEPRGLGPLARAFRRAVRMDHSHGWIRYGLDAAAVQSVFKAHPRENFSRVLLDFTRRIFLREPWTVVRGTFFGSHPEERGR